LFWPTRTLAEHVSICFGLPVPLQNTCLHSLLSGCVLSCWDSLTERHGRVIALVLRIWEIQGLNLGLKTGYSDWGFSLFSKVPPGKCQDSTIKLGHDYLLQNLFQFIIHCLTFHFVLYCLCYWKFVVKLIN
jgi:hypothetical protein